MNKTVFEDEIEISPGIYLSKLRKQSETVEQPELSKQDLIRILESQLQKLKYSNQEIQKQLQVEEDQVFREAIQENEILIARKEKELLELRGKEINTEIVLDSQVEGVYL